jgi:hypothetical protein
MRRLANLTTCAAAGPLVAGLYLSRQAAVVIDYAVRFLKCALAAVQAQSAR